MSFQASFASNPNQQSLHLGTSPLLQIFADTSLSNLSLFCGQQQRKSQVMVDWANRVLSCKLRGKNIISRCCHPFFVTNGPQNCFVCFVLSQFGGQSKDNPHMSAVLLKVGDARGCRLEGCWKLETGTVHFCNHVRLAQTRSSTEYVPMKSNSQRPSGKPMTIMTADVPLKVQLDSTSQY